MKVTVEQVAWIRVERHFTHELEIDPREHDQILAGEHDRYDDIEAWARDQELTGDYSDYDEDWLDDQIESVEVEEQEAAE
jgi:hypothetical protein